MALPIYKAAGAFAAGAADVTPALPTGWAVDDIFLLFVETANEAVTAPTGWTEVTNSPQGTGTAAGTDATRLTVFWRRAEANDTAPTITDPGNHVYAQIINIRGCVETGNPWDVTSGDVAASASTSVSVPTLTTTVVDCLIILGVANATDSLSPQTSGWTNANLANLTEITAADDNTNAGNGGGFGLAWGEKASAGSIGASTATLATSSVQGRMAIALKPVVPVTYVANLEQLAADHITKIATGGSTTDGNTTNIYLDALIAATVAAEKMTLKVEVETIATSFDNVANKTQAIDLWYNPENPHIRRGHTQVYDPTRKRMIVFGGWNGTTRYNDVWELTLDPKVSPKPQWRKLAPTGTAPSARNAHVAFFDNTNNRMIVGFGSTGSDQNDLYSLSFASSRDGAWTTLSPTGTIPAVRSQTSICADQTNKKAYLVAGWGAARLNDIQELDFSTTNCAWTQKSADGAAGAMSKRNDVACVWDGTNSRIVIFGGYNGTARLNDSWQYVPGTNTWTDKTSVFTGTAPSIRELHFHTLDTTNNRMVIFGGRNGTAASDVRSDMAYLTLTAGSEAWNVVTQTAGESSYGAWTNAGCYDPEHKLAICFGGLDSSLEHQRNALAIDCSSSSTLTMGNIVLNQYLRGRDAMAYAYNSDRDETLILGGYARVDPAELVNGDHTADMWIFKHATGEWIPAIRGRAWTPFINREGAVAIYDTNRARFVIFGGLTANNTTNNTYFNDAWELKADANGLYTLTKLTPTGTKPSARWLPAAVYDATNNRMVLFGGDDGSAYKNDVYALSFSGGANGAWSTISPTGTAPSIRRQASYAIDTGANEMLISHGEGSPSMTGDTFKLSLTSGSEAWSGVTGTGAPNARRGMVAIYRAADDAFYFFGGYDGTNHSNGTYKLTFGGTPAWSTLTPTGAIPDQRRSHAGGYSPTSGKFMIFGGRAANADTFDSRANTYEYNVTGNSWANTRPKVYIEGSVIATSLAAASYHWQAWVTGTLGGDSSKSSYGGNAENVADFIVSAGGTNYTSTLTDVLILVDVRLNNTGKLQSEAVTLVDTANKITSRALSDVVALVDTAIKTAGKVAMEVITIVDTITNLFGKLFTEAIVLVDSIPRSITRTLSDIVIVADTISNQTQKTFNEAIIIVDDLLALFGKTFTETIILVDSITAKITAKILTETTILVDSLTRDTSKLATEAIVLVDSALKTTSRTLSDVVILADTIAKQAQKALTEAVILIDSIAKSASRTLSDALLLVDSIAKQAIKPLTDALVLVDTLTSKIVAKIFDEAVILADSITRATSKVASEIVLLTDTATKQAGKLASESIILVDSIAAVKVLIRIFTEAIIVVDSIAKSIIMVAFAEIVLLADTLTKQTQRTLSDIVTLVDDLLISFLKTFSETILLADSIAKQTGKALTDIVLLADSITSKITAKVISEAIILADTISKSTSRAYTETIILIDDLIVTFLKTLTETILLVDSVAKSTAKAAFAEVVLLADSISNQAQKVFSEALILADDLLISFAKTFTETIVLADTIAKSIVKAALTEVVVLADSISNQAQKIFAEAISLVDDLIVTFAKTLSETLILADSIAKSTSRAFGEAVTMADSILKQTSKTFSDIVALVDTIATQILTQAYFKTLTEVVTLVDTISKTTSRAYAEIIALIDTIATNKIFDRILSETILIADTISRSIGKIANETITLVDDVIAVFAKTFTEAITLADSIVKSTGRALLESITIPDTIQKAATRTIGEILTLADTIEKQAGKILADALSLVDSIAKMPGKLASEAISLTDTISRSISRAFTEALSILDDLAAYLPTTIGNWILYALTGRDRTLKETTRSAILSTPHVEYVVQLSARDGALSTGVGSYVLRPNKTP